MIWEPVSPRQILEVWILTDTRELMKIRLPELDFELSQPDLPAWRETQRVIYHLLDSPYARVIERSVGDITYIKAELDEIGTSILLDALDYDDEVLTEEIPPLLPLPRIPTPAEVLGPLF
jgi:hypothetical protein